MSAPSIREQLTGKPKGSYATVQLPTGQEAFGRVVRTQPGAAVFLILDVTDAGDGGIVAPPTKGV